MLGEQIVIIVRSPLSATEARRHLKALPPWAALESQFHSLPPARPGEQPVLSEMRRTLRFVCPPDMDINSVIQRLKADPLVETAYREPAAEPA